MIPPLVSEEVVQAGRLELPVKDDQQHGRQAPLGLRRRRPQREQVPPAVEAPAVAHMKQLLNVPQSLALQVVGRECCQPDLSPERGPRAAVPVKIERVYLGLGEERLQIPILLAVRGEERSQPVERGGHRPLHALQDVLLGPLLELEDAPRGEPAEAPLEELPQLARRMAEQLAEVPIEPEARVLAASHVEDGEDVLAPAPPEASAELLQEDGGALSSPEEEERVHVRDVHPLVEQIHDAQRPHPARRQVRLGPVSLLAGRLVGEGPGRESERPESLRDHARVRLVHTERESTDSSGRAMRSVIARVTARTHRSWALMSRWERSEST